MNTPNVIPSATSASTSTLATPIDAPADALLPSDHDLMTGIQEADAGALKLFFQRHRKMLKIVILRTVNDDATAEDVLQECLLDLWRNARRYSPAKGSPMAWMVTLCRRRAIDCVRRSLSYCRAKDRYEESLPKVLATEHTSVECEQADLGRMLEQHLAMLPPPQQEVVRLAFLKGLSQREVARATQCPLGTVKTRLELGLKKLRQMCGTRSAIHSFQAA